MAHRVSHQLHGLAVAKARLSLKMTQEDLAERCGVHRVTIANIENDRARVSLEMLERLAAVLDKSRAHLLGQPEIVDPFDQARGDLATAVDDFGSSIYRLADLVGTLNARLNDAAAAAQVSAP